MATMLFLMILLPLFECGWKREYHRRSWSINNQVAALVVGFTEMLLSVTPA